MQDYIKCNQRGIFKIARSKFLRGGNLKRFLFRLQERITNVRAILNNTLYLIKIVWQESKLFIFLNAGFALISGIIPLLSISLSKAIVNQIEASHTMEVSFPFLFLTAIMLISIISILMDVFNSSFVAYNSENISMKMELRILNKMKQLDIVNFDKTEFNELYSKIRGGINANPSNIVYGIFDIGKNIIIFISLFSSFIILPVGNIKWGMIIISIIAAVPKLYFVNAQVKMRFEHNDEMNLGRRKVGYFRGLLFNSSALDESRIYEASNYFIDEFQNNSEVLFQKDKKLEYRLHILNRLASVISVVVEKIPYIVALYLAYTNIIELGQFVMITGAISQMTQSIISCLFSAGSISSNSLYVDYLKQFFEIKDSIMEPLNDSVPFLQNGGQHSIEFRDVWFAYPEMEESVLRGISFRIEPGQTAALVGLNGCGKSTIIKLMIRLYEPDRGEILIDDIPIEKYPAEDLYSNIGVVFQDFCKYAVPVSESIWLGDLSKPYDQSRAEQATKKSELHDTIMEMELGYDTMLTKAFQGNSIELSTGQWQKLTIARAFYRNSEILILDEPSASLDIETEYKIFRDMERLKGNKTSVFVSHNLSSVTICNKIFLIQDGVVADQGTHEYLMDNSEDYRNLFLYRAARYQAQ